MTDKCFLNWVRHSFGDLSGENHAQQWRNFFSQNIGMFLRNAVMYEQGNIDFYLDQSVILEGSTPFPIGTDFIAGYALRSKPDETSSTRLKSVELGDLPTAIIIYGWLDAGGLLGDNLSTYWLLIGTSQHYLVWIASAGIAHSESEVKSRSQISGLQLNQLNPARSYMEYGLDDLSLVIGE